MHPLLVNKNVKVIESMAKHFFKNTINMIINMVVLNGWICKFFKRMDKNMEWLFNWENN